MITRRKLIAGSAASLALPFAGTAAAATPGELSPPPASYRHPRGRRTRPKRSSSPWSPGWAVPRRRSTSWPGPSRTRSLRSYGDEGDDDRVRPLLDGAYPGLPRRLDDDAYDALVRRASKTMAMGVSGHRRRTPDRPRYNHHHRPGHGRAPPFQPTAISTPEEMPP